MAIAIKSIPTLKDGEAKNFVEAANVASEKKASVNFSKQVAERKSILKKAGLK